MIVGTIINRRPIVPLRVRGPQGQEVEVETLLDTGFNGFLCLSPAVVSALALLFLNYFHASLADGTRVRLEVYAATVDWDGTFRDVEVLATSHRPLLGTALLDGHEVTMQFADGGLVSIAIL